MKDENGRICPVCGNHQKDKHIFAILNEVENHLLFFSGCACSACNAQWDEMFDAESGEMTDYNIKPANDMRQP